MVRLWSNNSQSYSYGMCGVLFMQDKGINDGIMPSCTNSMPSMNMVDGLWAISILKSNNGTRVDAMDPKSVIIQIWNTVQKEM